MNRLFHKRLCYFEPFDRIELVVVPRYKTSGLSGDEWRQHVAIRFYFKGSLVHEASGRSMQDAILLLGREFLENTCPIPKKVIERENGSCDQPSCEATAVGRYLLKREFSNRGEALDPSDSTLHRYRRFCAKHAMRGDCGREDSDRNYEPMDGLRPDASTNTENAPSDVMVVDVSELLGDISDLGGKGGVDA